MANVEIDACDPRRLSNLLDTESVSPAIPISEGPGTRIGRYKLLQLIGEGGFGSVFMAEQETPVVRKVAMKIIKLGMDTKQVIARFEAERQALAMMDHPNIAKVFDAGATETGRPYFVMELVKGIPITEFCNQHHLPARKRLELFIEVCKAIQHAHQKGVIHRDLKPSNVLVTLHDGTPVPKVIDFGIAKATNQRLTEHTLFTEFRLFIGTPHYMPPEQADISGLDVDTRADIYSLGVLLYELLTDTTPFDPKQLSGSAYGEIQRIIREVEPPRPSTRLSTMGAQLADVAARMGTDPKKLNQLVTGELDWIVMKCLEKDRSRRYETANALARDVQRYLSDEPVEASPPSATYKLRKLLRKHKRQAAAFVAIFVALLLGIIGTSLGLARAQVNLSTAHAAEQRAQQSAHDMEIEKNLADAKEKEAREAQQREASQRKQAEAVADMLESIFHSMDPTDDKNRGVDLMSDLINGLNDTAAMLDKDASVDPFVRARLLDALGWTMEGLGEEAKALNFLASAVKERKAAGGAEDARYYKMLFHLGIAYQRAGRDVDATKALEKVRDWQLAHLGPDDRQTLTASAQVADEYRRTGRFTDAVHLFEQVRDRQIAALGPDDRDTLHTQRALSAAYGDAGLTAESIKLLEYVCDRQSKKLGSDDLGTLISQSQLAERYARSGKAAQAVALLTRVREQQTKKLGPEHPQVFQTIETLAIAYEESGRFSEAISLLERLRETAARKSGAEHPQTDDITHLLATMYEDYGRRSDAVKMLQGLRSERMQKLGPDDPATLRIELRLAYATLRSRPPEAVSMYEDVRDRQIARLGADDSQVLYTLCMLAQAYRAANRVADAIPILEKVREKLAKTAGPEHSQTMLANFLLAQAYRNANRPDDAVHLFAKLYEIAKRAGNLPACRQVARELSDTYMRFGRAADAIKLLEDVRDEPTHGSGDINRETLVISTMLVKAYSNAGRYADAVRLAEETRKRSIQVFGLDDDQTIDNTNQLIDADQKLGRADEASTLRSELLSQKIGSLSKKIRHDPADTGLLRRRAGLYLDMGKRDLAIADINRAVDVASQQISAEQNTSKVNSLLATRAELFARAGNFTQALVDYKRLVELAPEDHPNWHNGFVPLLLQAGDAEGYRHWRSVELQKFKDTSDANVAHRAAKDAVMIPLDGEDLRIAAELADRSLAGRTLAADPSGWTGSQTKGMVEYRSGHYRQAIPFLIHCRDFAPSKEFIAEAEYFLAMSCERAGNHAQAQAALERAGQAMSASDAGGDLLRFGSLMDWILCHTLRGEAEGLIQQSTPTTHPSTQPALKSWAQDRALYEYAVAGMPPDLSGSEPRAAGEVYAIRAIMCARLGRFQQAADDYLKAIDLRPQDARLWHDGIPLLLQVGDVAAFRQRRSRELALFKDLKDTGLAHCVAKDAFIMPIEGEDAHIAEELAQRALYDYDPGWGLQSQGMAEYRLGHYQEAISLLTYSAGVEEWSYSKTIADLFLAMSFEQLGDHAKARATLARATQRMEKEFPKPGLDEIKNANDWVICQTVHREAEALINGSQATTTQPTSLN